MRTDMADHASYTAGEIVIALGMFAGEVGWET